MEPEKINMTYKFEKSSLIIELHIYFGKFKANNKSTITIFHPLFVKRHKNKYKYKIIINNKLYPLEDKYQIDNVNMKQLKIKLLVLNDKKVDFSYFFCEYKSLKIFNLLSKEEEILEKVYKDENINEYSESEYNSNDLDNQLNTTFKNTYNNSDINTIINEAINIFYKNNYSNEDNNNDKRNSIINLSHDYLSPSYSTILKYNNDFEYCSSCGNSFILNFMGIRANFENIIVTNLSYMFYGCSSLTSISGLSLLNTSNVTNLSHMFENCSLLKEICDISKWDTKNVNELSFLFSCCSSLISLPDLSKWNIKNITNMVCIFYKHGLYFL